MKWGNLIERQDTRHAKSIAEFNQKNYRYQLSPLTVDFERLMISRDNETEKSRGTLDQLVFDRILGIIKRIVDTHPQLENAELYSSWEELFYYFKNLCRNSIDFFADIQDFEKSLSQRSDSLQQQKKIFREYLKGFILNMQRKAPLIEGVLLKTDAETLDVIVSRLVHYRLHEIFLPGEQPTESEQKAASLSQWHSLCSWFSSRRTEDSEQSQLMQKTMETIQKVTRLAARYGERPYEGRNRQQSYLYLAKKFLQTDDLEDAHKLSASVFGLTCTRHFIGVESPSEQVTGLWERQPHIHTTKPHTLRRGHGRRIAGEVQDRQKEKDAILKERQEESRYEELLLQKLLQHKTLAVGDLDVLHPKARRAILDWISKSSRSQDGVRKGMFRGHHITITRRSDRSVKLVCLDGTLTLPDYVIELKR